MDTFRFNPLIVTFSGILSFRYFYNMYIVKMFEIVFFL